jgi:hypothetical protein
MSPYLQQTFNFQCEYDYPNTFNRSSENICLPVQIMFYDVVDLVCDIDNVITQFKRAVCFAIEKSAVSELAGQRHV